VVCTVYIGTLKLESFVRTRALREDCTAKRISPMAAEAEGSSAVFVIRSEVCNGRRNRGNWF
jgi:hypothetical protein